VTVDSANDQRFVFFVDGVVIKEDTPYFFRVTHHDPNGGVPDESTPPPLPPVFTGEQAVGDVFTDVDVDSAVLSWTANVIGFGRADYGIASPDEHSATDQDNITDHAIVLSGLSAATTYQFRKATIWMQGVTPGLLRVEASSPDAGNRLVIPVVVRRS
jgi:hypothetical protein